MIYGDMDSIGENSGLAGLEAEEDVVGVPRSAIREAMGIEVG